MTPAEIAADVAERYGVTVKPDAVQIIPQGQSSFVYPVWDGGKLATPENSWKGQMGTAWRIAQAKRKGSGTSQHIIDRRKSVTEFHAQGWTDAEMAAHLKVSSPVIAGDRRLLRLNANRAAAVIPARDLERQHIAAEVARMAGLGMDRSAIAVALGKAPQSVSAIASKAGVALRLPPSTPRKPRIKPDGVIATTARRVEMIRAMIEAGATRGEIVAAAGMRSDSLGAFCRKRGIALPKAEVSRAAGAAKARLATAFRVEAKRMTHTAEVLRLHGEGMRPKAIAEAVRITDKMAKQIITGAGLEPHIYVAPSLAERNAAIIAEHAAGASFVELAARHGISDARVSRIVGRGGMDGKQVKAASAMVRDGHTLHHIAETLGVTLRSVQARWGRK